PTLKRYLEGISGTNAQKDGIKNFSRDNEYQSKQNAALATSAASAIKSQISTLVNKGKSVLNSDASMKSKIDTLIPAAQLTALRIKQQARTAFPATPEEIKDPPDRVSDVAKTAADHLESLIPSDFKI
ncbi:unnamed protein product, partial [marine sediment metagenome]